MRTGLTGQFTGIKTLLESKLLKKLKQIILNKRLLGYVADEKIKFDIEHWL